MYGISYTELDITKTIEQQITVKEKNIDIVNFKPRNNYLSALSIGIEGEEIEFEKHNRYYKKEVSKEVDKVFLEYETEDRLAKVEVIGSEELEYGKNIITIVVEAQNGWEREYVIEINRQKDEIQQVEEIKYEEQTEQNNTEAIKPTNKNIRIILLMIIAGIVSIVIWFYKSKRIVNKFDKE